MTITLELKPEEVAALNDLALSEGVDIETILHDLIAQMAQTQATFRPPIIDKQMAGFALMRSRRQDDQMEDSEEMTERDRELAEFQANINRWRAEEGRPATY